MVSVADLIILGLVALTALSGLRRGLVVGVFSLVGLGLGAYAGARLGPRFVGSDQTSWLPLIALGAAVIGAGIGRSVGALVGGGVRRALLVLGPLRLFDNLGGAILGAATALALAWAVGAALLYVPGQTELRRYAQSSSILERLNEEFPPQRLIDALAQIDPFAVLAGPGADVEAPDRAVLDSAGVNAAALSVVRVIGSACGLGVEGSGWVAAPRLVVTNAHVVAGIATPRVDRNDGVLLRAQVVAFDSANDIAVLRVPNLKARSLKLADAAPGTSGAMLGYPENGPYTETPVRVGRVVSTFSRDAFGRQLSHRSVTTIRGAVRSGNSGGPVVDAEGRVITTVFARRAGTDGGYGVPTELVRAAIAKAGTVALTTRCADR